MRTDPSYARAVSAWTAHLRAGGATPWAAWLESAGHRATEAPVLAPLPDAAHLELVRRLNLAAGPGTSRPAGLADRVLATGSPGRGLVEVPLPWPTDGPRFGTPAVDPALLPVEELIRLATGVLAHLLPGVPSAPPPHLRSPWPLPWRRRFRLHGAPLTVDTVRRSLLAQGFVESDRRTTHVVIGLPVDAMVAEHWASTVRAGGILKWRTVWRRAQAAGRLPRPVDVTSIAARLEGRPGEQVHVVLAQDAERAAELVARVLGAREVAGRQGVDLARCDLLRRVNRLTAMTQGPDRVPELAQVLLGMLEDTASAADAPGTTGAPVPPPLVPRAALPWARAVATTAAEELRESGYAVHGEPDALAPTDHRLSGTVDRERTLALALAACLRTWDLTHRRLGDGHLKEGGGQL